MPVLAALLALSAPAPSALVSFSHEPAPLPRLVASLAAQTGAKLSADPSLNEVVFVHATDVELSELKARIAQAATCRWAPGPEGAERLVPDDARRKAEDNAEEAAFRANVAKTLEGWAKPEPSEADAMREMFGFMGGMFGLGSDKLAKACALAVGAQALGMVGRDGRMVWATDPTPSQLALAVPGLDALVAQAVQEHNRQLDNQPDFSGDMTPEQAEQMRQMAQLMRSMGQSQKAEGKPGKVVLVATRGDQFGMASLGLQASVYNDQGTLMVASTAHVFDDRGWPGVSMGEAGAVPGTPEEGEQPPEPAAEWELSAEAVRFNELAGTRDRWKAGTPEAEAAKEMLLAIDRKDPLAYAPGEVLAHYAKTVGEDVVAWLPDGSFYTLGPQTNRAGVETSYGPSGELQCAKSAGWTVIRPTKPAQARSALSHRSDLAALIRQALESGRVSLDALASYAVRNPDLSNSPVAMGLMRTAGYERNGFMESSDRWLALRLYGSLAPAQRNPAQGISVVPAGAWSALQRRTVGQWVFGPEPDLTQERDPSFFDRIMQQMPFGGKGASNLALEPTQAAPLGLASLGPLEVVRTAESCFRPVGYKAGMPDSVGVEEMALLQFILSQKDIRDSIENDQPLPERFVVGQRMVYTLRIEVGPGVYATTRLQDDDFAGAGEPVGLAGLPEADIARIKSMAESIAKGPMGALFRMMGGMRDVMRPDTPPPG